MCSQDTGPGGQERNRRTKVEKAKLKVVGTRKQSKGD
jgi:hypothetical protein